MQGTRTNDETVAPATAAVTDPTDFPETHPADGDARQKGEGESATGSVLAPTPDQGYETDQVATPVMMVTASPEIPLQREEDTGGETEAPDSLMAQPQSEAEDAQPQLLAEEIADEAQAVAEAVNPQVTFSDPMWSYLHTFRTIFS